jgi:hypothetical protein
VYLPTHLRASFGRSVDAGGSRHRRRKSSQRPRRPRTLLSKSSVEGESSRAELGYGQHRHDQHQVVLITALRHPRAVLGVDTLDGREHRAGQRRRRQRREQTRRQQGSAARLADSCRDRIPAPWSDAEPLEGLTRLLESRSTEPAEELLGAVTDEQAADR